MNEILLVILGVIIALITSDIDRCIPVIARWIVRRYAAGMPQDVRAEMEPEWIAEVEAIPSHFGKLQYAVSLFTHRADLIRAHREPKVRGNVTIKLTGVSATGSVGFLQPGHIQIPPAVIRISDHVSAQIVEAVGSATGHIASTAHLFPPSITTIPPGSVTIVEPLLASMVVQIGAGNLRIGGAAPKQQ